MSEIPFKPNTTSYKDFETLSDLKWHCTKCELKSGQAKTWQVWRQEKGIQMDVDADGKHAARLFCNKCQSTTVHRKLKSLVITSETKSRSGLPSSFTNKVKNLYKNVEAIFLRKLSPRLLEVDHKFPQVRWGKDEEKNSSEMSDVEIKEKFILLTRDNNLLKSRECERCYKTGKRGCFPGIKYWHKGKEDWDKTIDKHDKKGCEGCFWYDPYKWRDELNGIVNK
ncbi:MAG: hypothetical protein WCT11_00700 [Candidatus Magasanikbacteria bacterium]